MKVSDCKALGITIIRGDVVDGGNAITDSNLEHLRDFATYDQCEIRKFKWRTILAAAMLPMVDPSLPVLIRDFGNNEFRTTYGQIKWGKPELNSEWKPLLSDEVENHYTDEMRDKGERKMGMIYIDGDGEKCEMIGENNMRNVTIGKILRDGTHPDYLSITGHDNLKPYLTAEQIQINELVKFIESVSDIECTEHTIKLLTLLQLKGYLRDV